MMESLTTIPASRKKSSADVRMITLGHAMTHWYPATFYVLLPLIGKELGLSYSQIGLLMTCQYVAGALSTVPGGMLADTMGRKGLLMALSLFWIGNNLWHPTAIPRLGQRYPEQKGLLLSLHGMGGNAGDALAPLAVGALLATTSIGVLFGMQAVGSSIGPVAGGMLADRYGIMASFWFLAGVIVVANLFIFLIPVSQARAALSGARPS